MNERICFSILTTRKYLKLLFQFQVLSISEYRKKNIYWKRKTNQPRIEKQIHLFVFLARQFVFWDLLTFIRSRWTQRTISKIDLTFLVKVLWFSNSEWKIRKNDQVFFAYLLALFILSSVKNTKQFCCFLLLRC